MGYHVISRRSDEPSIQVYRESELIEALNDPQGDFVGMRFLSAPLDKGFDLMTMESDTAIIIEGAIITPKAISVVERYELPGDLD